MEGTGNEELESLPKKAVNLLLKVLLNRWHKCLSKMDYSSKVFFILNIVWGTWIDLGWKHFILHSSSLYVFLFLVFDISEMLLVIFYEHLTIIKDGTKNMKIRVIFLVSICCFFKYFSFVSPILLCVLCFFVISFQHTVLFPTLVKSYCIFTPTVISVLILKLFNTKPLWTFYISQLSFLLSSVFSVFLYNIQKREIISII